MFTRRIAFPGLTANSDVIMKLSSALLGRLAALALLLLGFSRSHAQAQFAGTYFGTLFNTNAAGENVWLGIADVEFTVENDGRFTVTNQLFGTVGPDGVVAFDTNPGVGITNGLVAGGRMTGSSQTTAHDPFIIRFDAARVDDLLPMWTEVNSPDLPTSLFGSSVAFGNGLFMVLASPVATTQGWILLTSPDGVTWTPHAHTLDVGGADPARVYGSQIFFAHDRFWFSVCGDNVGGPNTLIFSTSNGESLASRGLDQKYGNLVDLMYVEGRFLGVMARNGGTELRIVESPDGAAFTLRSVAPLDRDPTGLEFVSNRYLITTSGATNYISPDGTTWTSVNFPAEDGMFGPTTLAGGNATFLAARSLLYTSADGEAWTQPSPGAGGGPAILAFADGNFYAVTRSTPSLYRSLDGNAWRKLIRPSTNTTTYFSETLAIGNGHAVISAQGKVLTAAFPAGEGHPVGRAPVITSHPRDVTAAACSFAFLQAGATTGGLPTQLQWFFNDQPLPGETNSTLGLQGVTAANQGQYALVARNALGTVTSASAQVTVTGTPAPPQIGTQPQSTNLVAGGTITLRVTATGPGQLQYTWSLGDLMVGFSSTLTIANATPANAGDYIVRVQNGCGFVDSQVATVVVTAGAEAPVITTQPQSQSVAAGTNVTFSVVAAGTAPLLYQWQKDGVDIDEATQSSLTLTNVSAGAAAGYSCVVSNTIGFATSEIATLTVITPVLAPTITGQPRSQSVNVGDSLELAVQATGTAPLQYQWQKNGLALAGATDPILNLPNIQLDHAGNYRVQVSNEAGSTISAVAEISVTTATGPPVITLQPEGINTTIGMSAQFLVSATGRAPLSYQWRHNGTNLPNATAAAFLIDEVSTHSAGTYSVVITNSLGGVTSTDATLVVNSPAGRELVLTIPPSEDPTQVTARILFVALGDETSVAFSLRYNTNALSQPEFTLLAAPSLAGLGGNGKPGGKQLPAGSTLATNLSLVEQGSVGITVRAPQGQTIPIGVQDLVNVTWTLRAGQTAADAGLTFTDSPVGLGATAGNTTNTVPTTVVPIGAPGAVPTLPAPQTGLFVQTVPVSNPGGTALAGVRVLVHDLGTDSLANAIVLYNAAGRDSVNVPYVEYGPLAPGATVPLHLEYYVSDRTFRPNPRLELQALTSLTLPSGEGLTQIASITQAGEGQVAVEFNTEAGRYYLIQYSSNLTNWVSSTPSVRGTGSRVQWLDTGPPRTLSHPSTDPNRNYRVLLSN